MLPAAPLQEVSPIPPLSRVLLAAVLGLGSAVGLTPGTTLATAHSVGVRAGDPLYRELRLAAAMGLLQEPPPGHEPLTRAELHRLMAPLGDLAPGTPAFTRLARTWNAIEPWSVYDDPDGRRTIFELSLLRNAEATYGEIDRGERAQQPLALGFDHTQGSRLERDGSLTFEEPEITFHVSGRLRLDRDALTYRPIILGALVKWGNARFFFGREPLTWGPAMHGNILLSTNARPLDQIRVESDRSFRLPTFFRHLGDARASVFAGRLDDPDRRQANPWLTGMRLTLAPARWLVLGFTRTAMLGSSENPYPIDPETLWRLLTAIGENSVPDVGDTDQKASVEASVYLWPLLRKVPFLDGGRFYFEYAGDDALHGTPPLPTSPAKNFGLELVRKGHLVRAEVARNPDDQNLWYHHFLYTDGYTYRGYVIGHPMGGDAAFLALDLEPSFGGWGLARIGYRRWERGFEALPGIPPKLVEPPVPNAVEDGFSLRLEKFLGDFPGAIAVEGRYAKSTGDVEILGPRERWGVTVDWRGPTW